MISKRGETQGWTFKKLLTIILLLIVMALVIYGFSVGGFGPLVERIEGTFNEILIFFGFIETAPSNQGCVERFFLKIPGHQDLLESLGYSSEDVENARLKYCSSLCELDGLAFPKYSKWGIIEEFPSRTLPPYSPELESVEAYRIRFYSLDGNPPGFEVRLASSWLPYDRFLRGDDVERLEFLREFYEFFDNTIAWGDQEGVVKKFYDARLTKRFVLWNKENGNDREEDYYALWENGNWILFKRSEEYSASLRRYGDIRLYTPDYDEMMKHFRFHTDYDESLQIIQITDETWYQILPSRKENDGRILTEKEFEYDGGNWRKIGELVPDCGGDAELDCPEGFETLKKSFLFELEPEFLESLSYSSDELEKMRGFLDSLEPFTLAEGTTFEFGWIDATQKPPVIVFTSSEGALGLRFYPEAHSKLPKLKGFNQEILLGNSKLPLELVYSDGKGGWVSVGDERDYKLPHEGFFEEFVKMKAIKKFLENTCDAGVISNLS